MPLLKSIKKRRENAKARRQARKARRAARRANKSPSLLGGLFEFIGEVLEAIFS